MVDYFARCNSLNDLKATYRKLALENHPDMGGDEEIMKEINRQHDVMFMKLRAKQNAQASYDPSVKKTNETPEEFRTIINALINLNGIVVELCGSWLWISGETYPHKEELKKLKCRWSRNKKMWYWRHADKRAYNKNGTTPMETIRGWYGSKVFTNTGLATA